MAQANGKSPATASAHTKGPWTYFACKNVWQHEAFCISSEDMDCIAITPGWDRRYFAAQEEANARLMALAPELLEACETFVDMARSVAANWENGRSFVVAVQSLVQHANAVSDIIDKAKSKAA